MDTHTQSSFPNVSLLNVKFSKLWSHPDHSLKMSAIPCTMPQEINHIDTSNHSMLPIFVKNTNIKSRNKISLIYILLHEGKATVSVAEK